MSEESDMVDYNRNPYPSPQGAIEQLMDVLESPAYIEPWYFFEKVATVGQDEGYVSATSFDKSGEPDIVYTLKIVLLTDSGDVQP